MAQVIHVDGFSAHGYLIVGSEIVAVDVGAPSVAARMVEIVSCDLGRAPSDITWVTATHYHIDHVGGIRDLLAFTPARVLLPEGIRGHVERGEPLAFPGRRRWVNLLTNDIEVQVSRPRLADLLGISRIGLPFGLNGPVPFEIAGYLADGDSLPGESGITVIATPGHTPCSVCFHDASTGTLLSGDTVLGGTDGPVINPFIVDREQTLRSVVRLQGLRVEKILPGHGPFWEGESLLEGIERTLAPEGLASIPFLLRRRLARAP